MKVMKLSHSLSMVTLIFLLGVFAISCNNVSDADIQTDAQEVLATNPELTGVKVSVQNRVATLTGVVQDDAIKTYAENQVSEVNHVTTVINQLQVLPPAPDYSALDNSLNSGLQEALKDHSTVTATVQNGVITLEGEINERDLPTLMEKINALQPEQVDNNITVK
jgi:osmotically-inducible protein OsmY